MAASDLDDVKTLIQDIERALKGEMAADMRETLTAQLARLKKLADKQDRYKKWGV